MTHRTNTLLIRVLSELIVILLSALLLGGCAT